MTIEGSISSLLRMAGILLIAGWVLFRAGAFTAPCFHYADSDAS